MDFPIDDIAQRNGFAVRCKKDVPEIDGQAVIMDHIASKAKLLYLKNDDNNKAFSITFKTPAADDTGVFHILEHSVLCGSKRFPVKEPFVNLLKSSMQTFLNAMTFPDKTMYPVASTNEQDLLNLMDVYMDAVFNPNIYTNPKIFEQEGWHLEVDDADAVDGRTAKLAYNGVVYNEMKGALSDPDSVLYDALSQALFPDTTYRYESGGIPRFIPDLSYEQFLGEHSKHYRPDNAYIVLYGDMDIDRFLAFLNDEYLQELASRSYEPRRENPLELQAPISGIEVIKEMATTPDNSCAALGYVVGKVTDRELIMATDVLIDAIAGSNEAPLMRALMDTKIADDCSVFLSSTLLQPFVVVQAKGLKPDAVSKLPDVVQDCIESLASGALDEDLIEAALSHAEFASRERNFGYADGVILSMMSMHGWLYDDDCALSYIEYLDMFESLRKKIGTGYYQGLLKKLFLDNDHTARAQVVPVEETNIEIDERLEELQRAVTEEEIEALVKKVDELRLAQEKPDDPEDLALLPKLSLSDIGSAPSHPSFTAIDDDGLLLIRHDIETHGIAYTCRYFDLGGIEFADLPYVKILAMLLGHLDTALHTAAEIDTLVQSKLGNMSFSTNVYNTYDGNGAVLCKFEVGSSALSSNAEFAFSIPQEVLDSTKFDDSEKIKEILIQKKVAFEANFMNSGHTVASLRSLSYCMPSAVLQEQLGGIDFYLFLKDLLSDFDERVEELISKMKELAQLIFRPEREICSFAGDDDALKAFDSQRTPGSKGRGASSKGISMSIPAPVPKREGFIVPSDVSFTALSANFKEFGGEYSGIWYLASRILSYDYLWNEVRVKGGAYGVSFQTGRSGIASFKSFRDPHIDETVKRYIDASAWLSDLELSDDEFAGYIVATIGSIDAPMKARALARRQDSMFLTGLRYEDRERIRQEVLEADQRSVRSLSKMIGSVADAGFICSVGSKDIIESSELGLEPIDLLA